MGNSRSKHDLILREMPQKVRELHYAVMNNDRETVRVLVQQGVNVNFPWYNPSNPSVKDGNTPLLCAVSLNHMEVVEILLKAGAYINKCDHNGCTPVYKAAFHVRPAQIELLSREGADVNLADFVGKTPLYICVNNSIVHIAECKMAVQKLIKAGAIIDKCNKLGQAPIHIAAHWKLVELLSLLIKSKANVNCVDLKGRTPLYICVSSLSTSLYKEDLRHQLPCILTLHRAGCDMLNLVEWIIFKGPGIPADLLEGAEDFTAWYTVQTSNPKSLKNICRKVIQMNITNINLLEVAFKLPLPHSLQMFVARKTFFREINRWGRDLTMMKQSNST